MVGTGDTVGSKERDDLEGSEASSVLEARQESGDVALGLRNETVDGGSGGIGATSKELELGCSLHDEGCKYSKV